MKKVIGIGNALVDIMTRLENDEILNTLGLPKASMQLVNKETSDDIIRQTSHLKTELSSGGSAANTIHGLANLGIETAFIGKTGKDEYGRFFRDDLASAGISPLMLTGSSGTGKAIALISPDSERTFATYLGAAAELTADDIAASLFNDYHYLYMEGYLVQNHDLIIKAAETARGAELKICLDLASYNVVEANLDFLKWFTANLVDIVFANEDEARAFTGLLPDDALPVFGSMCNMAVVKTGKNGSLITHEKRIFKVPAIQAIPIDTTGAGDLYAAGFIYGMICDLPLEQCGAIGSLLAGKVIEVTGAKLGISHWTEIRKNLGN
ncbi:MAG: adenosine kinase [Bacteroidia bacterium]|nr:adenosine kinase [Bacteroidia bacterium]